MDILYIKDIRYWINLFILYSVNSRVYQILG